MDFRHPGNISEPAIFIIRSATGRGEGEYLPARVVLWREGEVYVGAVEAVQERLRFRPVEESIDDNGAGFDVGGGCEGGERNALFLSQCADPEMVGSGNHGPTG